MTATTVDALLGILIALLGVSTAWAIQYQATRVAHFTIREVTETARIVVLALATITTSQAADRQREHQEILEAIQNLPQEPPR